MLVAGNGHDRHGNSRLVERIHEDEAFNSPLLQQTWIFVDQVGAMPVANDKIKISFLKQVILNTRKHQCGVTFADFRNDYSDRKAALLAQHPGHHVGTII